MSEFTTQAKADVEQLLNEIWKKRREAYAYSDKSLIVTVNPLDYRAIVISYKLNVSNFPAVDILFGMRLLSSYELERGEFIISVEIAKGGKR
jgi:hypothetical protein